MQYTDSSPASGIDRQRLYQLSNQFFVLFGQAIALAIALIIAFINHTLYKGYAPTLLGVLPRDI